MNKISKEDIEKLSKITVDRGNDSRTGGTGYIEWKIGLPGHIFISLRNYLFFSWNFFDGGLTGIRDRSYYSTNHSK